MSRVSPSVSHVTWLHGSRAKKNEDNRLRTHLCISNPLFIYGSLDQTVPSVRYRKNSHLNWDVFCCGFDFLWPMKIGLLLSLRTADLTCHLPPFNIISRTQSSHTSSRASNRDIGIWLIVGWRGLFSRQDVLEINYSFAVDSRNKLILFCMQSNHPEYPPRKMDLNCLVEFWTVQLLLVFPYICFWDKQHMFLNDFWLPCTLY